MPELDGGERIAGLSPAKRELLERWTSAADTQDSPAPVPPATEVERVLLTIWREVLRTEDIGVTDNFYGLGGDSITSLQIAARATSAGLRVSSRQVLETETVTDLAKVAVPLEQRAEAVATGPVPLTPIQRWFFEQDVPESHHWDQTIQLEANEPLDEEPLRKALEFLVEHHDLLKARFSYEDGTWSQYVPAERAPVPLTVVDLAGADTSEYDRALAVATEGVQARISLKDGVLLSAALFRFGGSRPDRLLLAIHHLVVDGVSLRVIREDLNHAYRQLTRGLAVSLPRPSTPFREWSLLLRRYADLPEVTGQFDYWADVPHKGAASLGVDHDTGENTVGSSDIVRVRLDAVASRALLQDLPRHSGVSVQHALLTCLLLAWQRCGRGNSLQADLEGHGREPLDRAVDVSRTVGWFTTVFPMRFELPDGAGPEEALASVRKAMHELPMAGFGYGLLRYLHPAEGARLAELPQSQISFNYLGRFDAPSEEDAVLGIPLQIPGLLQDPAAPRRYVFEVVVAVLGDELLLEWTYSRSLHTSETVTRLVDTFAEAMREMAREPAAEAGPGPGRGVR